MAEPLSKANSGYISDALAGGDIDNSQESRLKKSIGRGQTIQSDYALDNVELAFSVPDETGGKMGGSPTNLSHSLSGSSVSKADGE
jgi:hypothetical protein